MYATLGAGFYGMFALFLAIGGLVGAGALAWKGRFIEAGVVLVFCIALSLLCLREELKHPIYQRQRNHA